MIDLLGRKRIAELEARLEAAVESKKTWENLAYRCLDETAMLRANLQLIHSATYLGKSGTAKKVAKMAINALEGRT